MPAEEESAGAPSPLAVQTRVLDYWEATGVPASVLEGNADGPTFRFTEGPPTANGVPHVGHLIGRTVKDVELRYRRMRGDHLVSPMAGWDCHGLPVELEIEKRLGLKSKKEIEAYGVERFCETCRTSALEVASVWREMSRRRRVLARLRPGVQDHGPAVHRERLVVAQDPLRPWPSREGPLRHPVLPALRDPALVARGRAGVSRDLRPLDHGAIPAPGPGRGQSRPSHLDDDAVDASGEPPGRGAPRPRIFGRSGARRTEFVLASAAVPRYFPKGVEVSERLPGRRSLGSRTTPRSTRRDPLRAGTGSSRPIS